MDFIQLSLSSGYRYVLVMVCMFSHWTEAFPCRQATASFAAKALLEKIIPICGIPLEFIVIKEPILLVRYFNMSLQVGWFYDSFTALTTLNTLVS